MKKALIVLLLLAFVAGGLFAQFTVGGNINAGLGLSLGESYEDPMIGITAKDHGYSGGQAQFMLNGANEAKTAGLFIRFRMRNLAHPAAFESASGINDFINAAYGWLGFLDNKVTVYTGKFQNTGGSMPLIFGARDPLTDAGHLYSGTTGLLAMVKPMDMLAFTAAAVLPGTNDVRLGSTGLDAWKVMGAFGFGLYFKDMLDFTLDTYFGDDRFDMMAFVNVKAIKCFTMQVAARLARLTDFDNTGVMLFNEYFAFTGIQNLGLNLGLQQGITGKSGDDIFFKAWFWATYAMAEGKVVPRLDFIFAMGNDAFAGGLRNNSWYTNSGDLVASNITFSEGKKALAIVPSVAFKVGNNYVELGYALDFGIGDKLKGGRDGADHHVFIDFLASF